MTQLAQVVTDLGEAMRKAPGRGKKDEPEPFPSWLNLPLDDPEPAQELLGDLLAWMRDIYLRYTDADHAGTWIEAGPEVFAVSQVSWYMGHRVLLSKHARSSPPGVVVLAARDWAGVQGRDAAGGGRRPSRLPGVSPRPWRARPGWWCLAHKAIARRRWPAPARWLG
jgi:hypothetical protein